MATPFTIRSGEDLDGPTEVVAADAAHLLAIESLDGVTEGSVGDVTDRITVEPEPELDPDTYVGAVPLVQPSPRGLKRAASTPPPLPIPARRIVSPSAQLTPSGSVPRPSRRLASGTLDNQSPVPRSLGGYEVTDLIASGSMGVVYRGAHPKLQQPVAIKAMHGRLQNHPDIAARFVAESIALARINHPNVVRFVDFGHDTRGSAYLVMELLEGETLSSRMAREGRLDVAAALDIAIQIGRALAAAHEQGVVHRDLKPDNIFLCTNRVRSSLPTVKLLDFGVAKVADDSRGTLQGDLLGTPCYMAPEQGLSASASEPRSDLYAMGCILFEMVCGVVPFTGNLVETLLAHQSSKRPAARMHNPTIPRSLEVLIDRLLSRDPADRPPSATDVVCALSVIEAELRFSIVGVQEVEDGLDWPGRSRPRVPRSLIAWTMAVTAGVIALMIALSAA